MKEQFHSRIAKLLVVFALAVVASVMFVFVGCAPQEEEPAPEHTHTWETVTEDPTCGTDGYTYQECSCGEERNFRVLPATGEHEWETVTEAATCTTNGYTVQVCKNCGTEGTRTSIEALGHDYQVVTEGAVEETCTTNGYHFEECTRCHDRKQITDPALGHDLVAGTPIAATCTTNGYTPYECSRCDYVEQRNMTEKLEHDFGELTQYIPEDCTQDGYWYQECKNCGYPETSDRIPAKGHIIDFNETTTTITGLTCDEDGKVAFTCADCDAVTTASADDIQNGTVRVKNIPTKNPVGEQNKQLDSYYDVNATAANGINIWKTPGVEINAQYAAQYFLQSYGHDYISGNEYSCVKIGNYKAEGAPATDPGLDYWNHCDRCGEYFEVTAHTEPVGAKPCVAIANNKDYKGDLKYQAYTATGAPNGDLQNVDKATTAYVCTVCKQAIGPGDHDYQVAVWDQTSANPMVKPEDAKFSFVGSLEDFEGRLTCEYYLVCVDCGDIELAAPHTEPLPTDTANYRNCQHGDLCTVCHMALTLPLKHSNVLVSDEDRDDVSFGNGAYKYAAATCTADGVWYEFCQYCAATEKAGTAVEWVAGENYVAHTINKLNHMNWAKGEYTTTTYSILGDNSPIDCVTGTHKKDVCDLCGATRVETRPTIYKQTGSGMFITRTEIKTEADYDKAKDEGVKIVVADSTAQGGYADYKGTWDANEAGRLYTDANGYYGEVKDDHVWNLMALKDYSAAQLKEIEYAVCNNRTVKMYYECENCHMQSRRTVSLEQYVKDLAILNDEAGIDSETALDSDEITAAVNNWITAQKWEDWHVGTKLACGHEQWCSVCNNGTHNAQYYIKFTTVAGTDEATDDFKLDDFIYYACYSEAENEGRMYDMLNDLMTDEDNAGIYVYTFKNGSTELSVGEAFKSDSDNKKLNDAWSSLIVRDDNAGTEDAKPHIETITLTVSRNFVDENDETNKWFNSSYNGRNMHWTEENVLDVEFFFNNNVIPYTSIDSITVELTYGSGDAREVIAKAISRDEYLDNLWEASWAWGKGWGDRNGTIESDEGDPSQLAKPEELWISIGQFCSDFEAETNADQTWQFTYDTSYNTNQTFTQGQDLTGLSVTVTIVCDLGTFVSTSTVA